MIPSKLTPEKLVAAFEIWCAYGVLMDELHQWFEYDYSKAGLDPHYHLKASDIYNATMKILRIAEVQYADSTEAHKQVNRLHQMLSFELGKKSQYLQQVRDELARDKSRDDW